MPDSTAFLQDYRDRMDPAVEELGTVLTEIGAADNVHIDDELVKVAAKKLRTLYRLASVHLTPGVLAAIMKE